MRSMVGNAVRLLIALTLLASFLIRSPGTMLVREGETITYILCTGGEPETVRIALDGEGHPERDPGCDFFAAQVADLAIAMPDSAPIDTAISRLASNPQRATIGHLTFWTPYTARAPPHVS